MATIRKYLAATAAVAAGMSFAAPAAQATEGYFQHGYGARQTALAGAGVADSSDAMSLSLNPAGIVDGDNELQVGMALFSPRRGFTGSGGPSFTPGGSVDSGSEYFPIPNFGYLRSLDDQSAIAISVYGNGGMNTSYGAVTNPACGGGSGVFCGGSSGVNLNQLFVAVGYARRLNENFSIGVAPIFALQGFEARGLAAFSGVSSDPAHLTNNETDYSTGFGVRLGAQWALSEGFRLGASYQSQFNMSEFDDYAGLFEGGGDFDIPSSWTIGAAFDVSPNVTVMLDYRRINYTDVAAVSNSTTTPLPLGASGGPGFGWDDVDAYKLGVEWRANDQWTWRGGVAFNNNPIGSEDVTLNILAPGVQEQHYTGGFTYRMDDSNSFDFAFMYSPESSVSGIEVTPSGPNPGHTIELQMHQFEALVGWTHHFGR
ncbi:MAG: outer membrane protein transport protein [Hyphomonadaceae bacterium]